MRDRVLWYDRLMRDSIFLCFHAFITMFRVVRPGGVRSVVAESVLLKHQLLIVNRSTACSQSEDFGPINCRVLLSFRETDAPGSCGNSSEACDSTELP
jgi:hypothetical protein